MSTTEAAATTPASGTGPAVGGPPDVTPPPPRRRPGAWEVVNRYAGDYLGVGAVLIGLCIWLLATQPHFATSTNLIDVLETNAVLLVTAVGLTFVLLIGAIDLSVGGMLALSGIFLWELVKRGVPPGLAVVLCVAAGTLVGLVVNGVLIAKVRLSFLVVTLGTGSLFLGIGEVRTGGQSQSLYSTRWLVSLGSGKVGGVPYLVIIALVVLGIGIATLRYTGFGRVVYAVGGNPEAARLAGINVTAVRIACFAIAAGAAALAGVMETSRLTSASPTSGAGIELTAAAAVLLGGTAFTGGRGTLLGTLLGVLFLGVLSNGITLAGISPYWQDVVSGAVLVAAMAVDRLRHPRRTRVLGLGV